MASVDSFQETSIVKQIKSIWVAFWIKVGPVSPVSPSPSPSQELRFLGLDHRPHVPGGVVEEIPAHKELGRALHHMMFQVFTQFLRRVGIFQV